MRLIFQQFEMRLWAAIREIPFPQVFSRARLMKA
jgi:hypothetical protein